MICFQRKDSQPAPGFPGLDPVTSPDLTNRLNPSMINTTQKGLDLLDVLLRGRAHPRESHGSHRHAPARRQVGGAVSQAPLHTLPLWFFSWSKGPNSWCLGWQDGAGGLARSRNEQEKICTRQSGLVEETAWQMEERRRQRRGEATKQQCHTEEPNGHILIPGGVLGMLGLELGLRG